MQDFVFLVQSAPSLRNSARTREIRSHAMRAFRRKQRELSIGPSRKTTKRFYHQSARSWRSLFQIMFFAGFYMEFSGVRSLGLRADLMRYGKRFENKEITPLPIGLDSHFTTSKAFRQIKGFEMWRKFFVDSLKASETTLLAASCLGAVAVDGLRHFETGTQTAEYLYLKHQTIKMIRRDIAHPGYCPNESTIGAILCLNWAEVACGNPDSEAHFQALQQMLKITSARSEYNTKPQPRSLILQDLYNAVCSNKPPKTIRVPPPSYHIPSADEDTRTLIRSSPLRRYGSAGPALWGEVLPKELVQLLSDSLVVTEMRYMNGSRYPMDSLYKDPEISPLLASIYHRLDRFPITELTGVAATKEMAFILDACYLASKMHFRAVVELIPHSSALNADDFSALSILLRKTELGTWFRIPLVALWILFTGAAAAIRQHRRWYVGRISQLAMVYGLDNWADFNGNVLNFLWLQQYIREANGDNMEDVLEGDEIARLAG
ncbi:hypothetical protein K469DRAFT_778970 [Zopfia rhizophila CBS 207.26]|uniref:Transcription factor domain-containing protein n=1 Tax=Zopfia rhizophila CBS 207.26 TaxID=1314779 RepID=A0A6A6E1V6_9PEZI|nr:hypothetical protein K469DRAFT_778970 [Zopfia rhizophila CBS 207.26]